MDTTDSGPHGQFKQHPPRAQVQELELENGMVPSEDFEISVSNELLT